MLKHKCRLSAYFRQIGFYLIISIKSAELFFICNYTIWGGGGGGEKGLKNADEG